MTRNEAKKFRNVLEATVIEMDRSARRRDAIIIEGSADEFDRMLGATERELAVQSLEAASAKLRQARSALRRVEEGTYGTCLECEEAISPRRLAALPSAALCIRCQEAMDCRYAAKKAHPAFAIAA